MRNSINSLQSGKAQVHDGLVGEHFIYAHARCSHSLHAALIALSVKASLVAGSKIACINIQEQISHDNWQLWDYNV